MSVNGDTRYADTASGRVGYTETGSGPEALFVHGVLMNKHLWRYQMDGLADVRRCIAVDLLTHGDTDIDPDQDVSVAANAQMLAQFLDALQIDQADVIGNDSGGGLSQIFAANNPGRVRNLTLTDCDTSDNWPPEAFKPFLDMAAAGGLSDTLNAMLGDKSVYRSPNREPASRSCWTARACSSPKNVTSSSTRSCASTGPTPSRPRQGSALRHERISDGSE